VATLPIRGVLVFVGEPEQRPDEGLTHHEHTNAL
jgi:hypothetical protein